MMYEKWHWLHPAGWFLWIAITGYVIFAPFAIHSAQTSFELIDVVIYAIAFLALITPLALLPIKPLRISGLKLNRKYVYAVVIVYVILSLIRYSFHYLDYEFLRTGISSSLFYLNVLSWLLVFSVFTLPMVAKYRGLQWLMLFLELLLLFFMGFREWAIVFLIGFLIVLASLGRSISWSVFPIGLVLFITVISPLWFAQRSASSYLEGLSEMERQEETRGKHYHTSRYLFAEYGYFVRSATSGLGARGEASLRIIHQTRTGQVDFYELRAWSRQLNQIFVPRVFWPEKPSFRPGEEVYTTFYDTENPRQVSHPSGFVGEFWWLAGWWSLLLLPLFGWILAFLAKFITKQSLTWVFLHFLLFFLFWETHLIFYLSGWIRVLPVYLIFWYLLKKYKN